MARKTFGMRVLESSRSGVGVDVPGAGKGLRSDMGAASLFAGESMPKSLSTVASEGY